MSYRVTFPIDYYEEDTNTDAQLRESIAYYAGQNLIGDPIVIDIDEQGVVSIDVLGGPGDLSRALDRAYELAAHYTDADNEVSVQYI